MRKMVQDMKVEIKSLKKTQTERRPRIKPDTTLLLKEHSNKCLLRTFSLYLHHLPVTNKQVGK